MTTYKIALGPPLQQKLAHGDPRWDWLNTSFENSEVTSLELEAAILAGRPFTTWHKDQRRKTENYLLGQHLGLDFDTGDQRSNIDNLLTDELVFARASVLYTTPSHTPDAPRARVVFFLDTPIYQAKNYALASTALLAYFGTADRQCKDAVRFFYGGKPGACETRCLDQVLPLEIVKDMITRYKIIGAEKRRKRSQEYEGQTPDEAEVVDALKHIDAWGIDYGSWIQILMAIHSAFPNITGLQIAESWADGKPGEVEQKWKSFNPGGNGAGRIGIGTLFALAKEAGWVG